MGRGHMGHETLGNMMKAKILLLALLAFALAAPAYSATVSCVLTNPITLTSGGVASESMTLANFTDLASCTHALALTSVDMATDVNLFTKTEFNGRMSDGAVGALGAAETLNGNWVNTANPWAVNEGGTGSGVASTARTNLGLAIGSDVQAWDAELDTIAALSETTGNVMIAVGSAWASVAQPAIDCTNCTALPGEANRTESVVFETATTADDVRFKASAALTIVQLDCVATGATTPSVQVVRVVECTNAAASCADSGFQVSVSALTTNAVDATGTDAAIDDGDWWGLDTVSLTTAADYLHCTVEYSQ